jgi:hypothetical protein
MKAALASTVAGAPKELTGPPAMERELAYIG